MKHGLYDLYLERYEAERAILQPRMTLLTREGRQQKNILFDLETFDVYHKRE